MGRLEFNALVAHDARNILKEIATLKSQRNDEWWRAHQLGLPAPAIKTSFAYDKFGAMLAGAGVKMNKEGNHISLGPLTDKDVTKMSAGAIKRPLFVKAKDLSPERGGFFDPVVTGGLNGTKWSHVDLIEPVVNPVFERPVKTFLGMTQSEFEKTLKAEGGGGIKDRLSKIDLGQREKNVMAELTAARADKRDNLVKELKYLRALNSVGMRPEDAYITSKIPVPPPIYRPIVPGKTGDLQISDANSLLRDAMIANDLLSKTRGLPGVQEDARKHLYDSMGALYGLHDPVSPQLLARNAQGYIARIAGVGSPKSGFFQSKLVKRQQDISGRGTIVPDSTLAMDEVGLPEDAGWAMFAPFVIKSLVQRGYGALDAKKMVEDRHPVAKETLLAETRNRPVLVNRAPSLYRYNVLAAYPKLVPGKTIRVPEALAPIQSGDYDGDAVTIMAPVTAAAVEEARGLTLPNMLLSDQRKFTLTKAAPQQESVLGLYKATSEKASGKAQTFETKGDALEAYHRGEISLNTPVTIKRHTTKLSSELGILNWCGRNEDV
jgi:DNA-directed RNA polymerase subunit beta'